MKKKWVSREVDGLQSTDEFMERLNRWSINPDSDPKLEEWYKLGYPEGLPFEIMRPEQWELDHAIYLPMYEEARRLEQSNQTEKALEIYLEIHERFIPRGSVYYDHPIWLLEKNEKFELAIALCNKIINAVSEALFNADVEYYKQSILRLQYKQEQRMGYPSYEAFVFTKVVEIVKLNPGINKTQLQRKLNEYHVDSNYIEKAVEQKIITRERHGRSLILNLP